MTRRRSRLEPRGRALWGWIEQRWSWRGENVVHSYPLFGREHVLDGYPGSSCWCQPTIELLDGGAVVSHNQAH